MSKNKVGAVGIVALLACTWGALGQETRLAATRAGRPVARAARQHRGALGVAARRAAGAGPGLDLRDHGDDIRRSGATSLPEALRLAPNLHVARADANQYAISARGFNKRARQQAAGADRRPHRLHAAVLRRVLGRAGRDARGRRAHRGDQRPGRDAVGRQRRQRRDQRHHAPGAGDAGRACSPPAPATAQRDGAVRYGGAARRERPLPRLRQGLRARQHASARAARRSRDGWSTDAGRLPRRLGRRGATASRCRAMPTAARSTRPPAGARARRRQPARRAGRAQLGDGGSPARAGLLRPHRARPARHVRRAARHLRRRVAARARAAAGATALLWGGGLPPYARPRREHAPALAFLPADKR